MATLGEFNQVSFQLPLETFGVNAYITQEERMPVVTEYVLRLLRICGRLPTSSFQRYFGFSTAEVQAVLESMSRQGLVELTLEGVALSRYAEAQFDASHEDYPLFAKVEPYLGDVTFDLLTFNPIRRRGGEFWDHLAIDIEIPPEVLGHSVERARQAFSERFADVAAMNGRLRQHAVSVYSIAEIHSKKRGTLLVPVSMSVGAAGQVERNPDETFARQASPELQRTFQQSVSHAVQANTGGTREGRLEQFVDTFDLRWLRAYFEGRRFDMVRYAADVAADRVAAVPDPVVPLFGGIYLTKNLNQVIDRIKYRAGRWKGEAPARMMWLAPRDGLWGRTPLLSSAWMELDKAQAKIEKRKNVLCIRGRAEDEPVTRRRFERLLRQEHSQLRLCPPLYAVSLAGDPMLEVILFADDLVVAMCHVPVDGEPGVFVPVGFVSHQDKHYASAVGVIRELDPSLWP
jgi:hypothetical protein